MKHLTGINVDYYSDGKGIVKENLTNIIKACDNNNVNLMIDDYDDDGLVLVVLLEGDEDDIKNTLKQYYNQDDIEEIWELDNDLYNNDDIN